MTTFITNIKVVPRYFKVDKTTSNYNKRKSSLMKYNQFNIQTF